MYIENEKQEEQNVSYFIFKFDDQPEFDNYISILNDMLSLFTDDEKLNEMLENVMTIVQNTYNEEEALFVLTEDEMCEYAQVVFFANIKRMCLFMDSEEKYKQILIRLAEYQKQVDDYKTQLEHLRKMYDAKNGSGYEQEKGDTGR